MRIPIGRNAVSGYLGAVPPASLRSFSGPNDTLAAMGRAVRGPRGEQSFRVRQFTESVVRNVWPKDYLGEILAVRNLPLQLSPWTNQPILRYTNDPRHVELVKDPQRIVEEIDAHGSAAIDCDESATLLATMLLQLGREAEFVALGFAGRSLTHVGLRVKEPKSDRWIWIDTVAGPREREAAQRAVNKVFYSLD